MIGSLRISLSALRHNAELLRALVGSTNAAFVVKGNAYGHGAVDVARAIENLAPALCIYSLDEAIELRDGGIRSRLLVLGPIQPESLSDAIAAKVDVALWDTKGFVDDVAAAAKRAQMSVPVHVKINTGLNRLGLAPDDLAGAVETYTQMPNIEIAGVFSHLAAAEELDSPYTMEQLARFEKAFAKAEPLLASQGKLPTRHIAASAAAILWPQTRLDMSRFGIALYGLWPSAATREAMNGGKLPLEPALSYITEIVAIQQIAAGEPVGYGTTYHAPRAMRVGVIPLGYADGIPRALSNKGAVLIDGIRCAIIGRVAMNMCFVDLTHAPNAHVGSQVTLIGRDGKEEITADDWAYWAETINYEIVTRLPSTLKRVFTD